MSTLVVAIGVGPFGRLQSGALAEAWGVQGAAGVMAGLAGLGTVGVAVLVRGFLGKK